MIQIGGATLLQGDSLQVLAGLPAESVRTCVTSPPYWGLRDYGVAGQLGLEPTVGEYVEKLVAVFREVRRVLRSDGTAWLNLGDSFAGGKIGNTNGTGASGLKRDGRPEASRLSAVAKQGAAMSAMSFRKPLADGLKPKDLVGVPWRVAFALQDDGWWLRSDIIWAKPNPMPESVTDRPTKAHEYLFLLTKSPLYFYDAEAVKETATATQNRGGFHKAEQLVAAPGAKNSGFGERFQPTGFRNIRSVWTIATAPYAEAHFATFPPELAERCIKAGCPAGGTVLDPFAGASTTLLVAERLQRRSIGIELNPAYVAMGADRIRRDATLFAGAAA